MSVDPFSRRDLLKVFSKTIFGCVILGVTFASPIFSKFIRRHQMPIFRRGSIFTPAEDKSNRT